MFEAVQNWFAARRRREFAIRVAMQHFQRVRGIIPMGGNVLHFSDSQVIVRVMFFTDHIPSDRAWCAVSSVGVTIRELAFYDVEALETPWR